VNYEVEINVIFLFQFKSIKKNSSTALMGRQRRSKAGPMAGIIGLGIMLIMGYVVFKMVSGAFAILSFLAIPLFIIALVLNYRVVSDYFNFVVGGIKKDPAKGLVIAAASVIGYPLVAAWLAFKAYTTKKFGKGKATEKKKEDGEYLKYEEVDPEEDDFLDLEDLDQPKTKQKVKQAQSKTKDDYEDLFS